jgi:DNA-binding transcriptional LysR family regulator
MDDVEVRELRYFIAVAEELNFTRAATRLGMSQPPLSAAIGKLEHKLGAALFNRTSRRVVLTQAGAVLLAKAQVAVDGVTAAAEGARRAALVSERLVVAVKPGAGTQVLPEVMRRWSLDRRLPELQMLFAHPAGPVAALRSGTADVAIVRRPFDTRGLDTELLIVEPRVAVLRGDHRLADYQALRRSDLAGEPMPRWAGSHDPTAARHWQGGESPVAERREGPEISHISQLFDAVALCNAVAYVPISLAEQNHHPELTFLPVSDLTPSEVVVVWLETCRSRAVAQFVRTTIETAATT